MINVLLTGASAGLGRALAFHGARRGWHLSIDARRPEPLAVVREELGRLTSVRAVAGDVADPPHRRALVAAAAAHGPIDVLILNASELGGSPPPRLRDLDEATALRLWQVNVSAPLHLIREAWPHLSGAAVIVSISSDGPSPTTRGGAGTQAPRRRWTTSR